jgi:ATP-dependent DNA ligase
VFQQACRIGHEGIVSKRLSAPYRSGPSRDWIKVKNPDCPVLLDCVVGPRQVRSHSEKRRKR